MIFSHFVLYLAILKLRNLKLRFVETGQVGSRRRGLKSIIWFYFISIQHSTKNVKNSNILLYECFTSFWLKNNQYYWRKFIFPPEPFKIKQNKVSKPVDLNFHHILITNTLTYPVNAKVMDWFLTRKNDFNSAELSSATQCLKK